MSKKKQKDGTKGKKSTLIVILLLLISIIACTAAGYMFYEVEKNKFDDVNKKQLPVVAQVTPIYVPMDTFTVSLSPSPEDSEHVLYIGLTLRVKDDNSKLVIDKFLPEVRSRIFILLAHQTAEDVSTDEGKSQLIEKIKTAISKPLAPHQSAIVTDVLFNAFIIR